MEKYRKKLEFMLKLYVAYCCILVVLIILYKAFMPELPNAVDKIYVTSFWAGCIGVALSNITRTRKLLKNEDDLKKAYIAASDERIRTIRQSASETTLRFIMIGLSLAMIISVGINKIVCLSLLGALMFVIVVMIITEKYYYKKL